MDALPFRDCPFAQLPASRSLPVRSMIEGAVGA